MTNSKKRKKDNGIEFINKINIFSKKKMSIIIIKLHILTIF